MKTITSLTLAISPSLKMGRTGVIEKIEPIKACNTTVSRMTKGVMISIRLICIVDPGGKPPFINRIVVQVA